MSPLIRPAAPAPIVRSSPGGAIVRAPGGAAVPWVQRITTGVARGVGALGIPGAAIAVPAAVGAATLPWVVRNWRGGPGAESMNERRGLTPATPQYKPHYGPAFDNPARNTGVGGGNAGASRASQWRAPAAAPGPAPPPPPRNNPSPVAQQSPRLPAGRNVAIVNPPERARNRALNIAAQNAGLPAMRWESGVAEFDAAKAAGEAAAAARAAQGGRGYLGARPAVATTLIEAGSRGDYEIPDPALSFSTDGAGNAVATPLATSGGLPDTSNPASQAYWNRADIRAWANASEGNRKLAEDLQRRVGFTPTPAARAVPQMTAAAATTPPGDFSEPVNRNWVFNLPESGQMERLAAAAADQPNFNSVNLSGGDFRPGPASAAVPANFNAAGMNEAPQFRVPPGNVLPGGVSPIDEASQARLQGYLRRIKSMNLPQWDFTRGVEQ